MAERAHVYLGNLSDPAIAPALKARVAEARQRQACLDVELTLDDNRKGRIHAHATMGESVGLIKDREQQLKAGDLFETESGRLVQIQLQDQTVLAIQVNPEAQPSALALIHLGHTLGNHHYPIVIQNDKIYVRLEGNAEIVEATIRSANIPGLHLTYEQRSADQAIAFDASGHSHGRSPAPAASAAHAHAHAHPYPHS